MEPPSDLRQTYRTAVIIGVAMMGSLVAYLLVGLVIKSTEPDFEGFAQGVDVAILRYLFVGLALAQIVAIRVLKSTVFRDDGRPAGPVQPGRQRDPRELTKKLLSSAIVTFALAEAIGIYGLILFLLGGRDGDLYLFVGISALVFLVFFPRYSAWEEWLKRQTVRL